MLVWAAFAGCGAGALTDGTGGAGGSGAAGNGEPTGMAGTTGTGGTAGVVSLPPTCPATCETPAGTVFTFSSPEQATTALTGVWQICTGSGRTFPTAPADAIGIEYGPASPQATAYGSTIGGNMYYLVQGAAGPVRGAGFDYQLTYDVTPLGPGSFQLNMHPTPNSGFGGGFRYSPCPQEFEISGGSVSPADRAILVRF